MLKDWLQKIILMLLAQKLWHISTILSIWPQNISTGPSKINPPLSEKLFIISKTSTNRVAIVIRPVQLNYGFTKNQGQGKSHPKYNIATQNLPEPARITQSIAGPARITQSQPELRANRVITVLEEWENEVNMLRYLNSHR